MQPERMRILEMLQEGKIDAEQALRLLEAVDKAAGRSEAAASPPSPPPREQPEAGSRGDWGAFGRDLAARISRSVQQSIAADIEEGAGGTAPSRANFGRARLTRNALSRMQDGTHYINFGQLIVQEDVPEELVRTKITGFTNFGWVTGPEPITEYLEEICDRSFGGFGGPGEAPGPEVRVHVPRPHPHPHPHPHPAPHTVASAPVTTWEVEGFDQLAVTCYAGNLEFAGGDDLTLTLRMSRLLRPGETLPEGWEAAVPLEVHREESPFRLVIGERDNPKATENMTFHLTVPGAMAVTAETMGGSVSAQSIENEVNLKTRGGDIECKEIGGDVTVDTAGGSVALHEISGAVQAKTAGGDVQCSEIEGDVNATSAGGNISFSEIHGALTARTGGGNVQVSEVEGDVTVDTGGGDVQFSEVHGAVKCRTGGGDIRGSEAEGDVTADTGGGDVSLSEIHGTAAAISGAGDISLSEVEGDASARTGSGDIRFSSISGSVQGRTGNGDISVAEVEGDADVKTSSGDISLSGVSGEVTMNRGR
jgi:hypothetical protein